MAKVKKAQMAKDELLDNIQKFVLCGRAMLDAIEDLTNLYFCTTPDKNDEETGAVKEPVAGTPVKPEAAEQAAEPHKEPEAPKTATMEEVRGLMAEKSRNGFRAEVKALLTMHGVQKLSEITDPVELGTLLEEAGQIGVT